MARDRRDDQIEQLAAEVDALAPYLDLAREIRGEVERFAADDDAQVESFAAALDAIPARARADMARSVFERLSPEGQWSVLERLFDDDELRAALASVRDARLADVRRLAALRGTAEAAVSQGRLDTRLLPDGTQLSLGLFRPEDVRAAATRGRDSDVCARLLVLRATAEPGELRVIDDVFNPRGGLFVSAAYDRSVWRDERLTGHSAVRVGSVVDAGGQPSLEPVVYLGARMDVESDGRLREGRLHLGYALLGDLDAFAASS